MYWYLKVLRQYFDFTGRAGRKEFWIFLLFNLVFLFMTGFLDASVGPSHSFYSFGFLSGIYTLFILIPFFAVSVRRIQDAGENGWMILIALIPVLGTIWFIVICLKDSDHSEIS